MRIYDFCAVAAGSSASTRENMLDAAILRSPVAHGLVVAVDASAALAIAGVHAVISAKDIGTVPRIPLRLLPLPGTERFLQPVIVADRVCYVGEPVAVVLTGCSRHLAVMRVYSWPKPRQTKCAHSTIAPCVS